MSAERAHGYTPFPDLRSHRRPVLPAGDTASLSLQLTPAPLSLWICAWAHLLRGYAGEEQPVFLVDHQAIRFDVSRAARATVDVDEKLSRRAARTSIETGELDRASPPPALALLVDPASDRVTLHASDWLPPEHLPQIGKQLASLVNWLHGPSTQPMPWRAVDGLMLAVLNPAPAVMPGARLLHHLVRKTSTQHADAIEFLHGDGTKEHYSYERLHDRSDALAARIRGMLVTDDDVLGSRQRIIPILMSQRPELYVALLAVLKAGAAFCPVDLDAPEQRLKHVAQDVAARLVITEVSLESRVTWEHGPSVLVTDCPNDRDANAEEIHGYTPTPDDLAYVMYTSGSTGLPKAVAVSHAAVTQSILAHEQHLPPFHRFLQFAAPSFDVSIFEIFFPLFRGATLVGCHRDGLLTRLPSVMHDMEIDAAELTPTVAGALLRTRKQVPGLRLLLTIGELLTSSVVQEFGGSNDTPNILHAMYGPTEAAIHCTLVSPCSRDAKPANIGKPLETVSALVIAADDPAHVRPLPVGHVGELAVGGHQLAHGYLNHPAKTEAAFGFSSEHGRVYRTGDKARLLPDGTLQFLGRITSGQVKLRGQRVELSEVEYAVDQSPDVHSPTAVVIDGILVVFALRTDATSRVTSVMDACRRWLPSFMRPGDVVLLDDFPRSSSGKIDRRSLEHSYREAGGEQHLPSKDVETWTETESIIREILSSLSGYPIQNISRTVTIFQLGIDSLAAAQIATQLREQEVAVTVSDVLEHPSPAALAEHLRTNLPSSTSDTPSFAFASFDKEFRALVCKAASIDPSLVEAVRPCTPLVAGIVARFVQSQGSMYLNHYLLRWPRLDRRRLRTAWDLVTKNHDMLRTGFCETGDPHHPFVMITYRAEEGGVPHVDDPVPSHPLVATQDLRHRWSAEMVSRLHAPAWRWSVIEDRETCLVQVSVLHALYDAISLQCFLADLARAYHAHPLAPTESVEPAMASILHSSQAAPPGRDHFWRKLGETMHISKFPTITSTRVESQKVVVRSMRSTWSLAQLAKACQTNGIALQAAGQAAWARILAAYLGDDNVTFGLILSGRLASHLTATVAFPCISTVPMVCSLHGDNISLVRRIMHLSHGLLEHQHTPSSTIQRLTGHVGHALFDTVFAFQKLPTFVEDQARPWTIIEEVATAEFPISIELEPTDEDDLDLRITFREDVLSAQQAEILLKQLDGVLIDTVLRPHQDCTDTSHLEASILSATPAVDAEIASEVSVLHGFVEEHARAMPDRVALEWTTDLSDDHLTRSQWTYRELNRFGNRVAHLLVTLGARPGGFIGICFDKCPQASFAILGILKAGCAFVALDPDAPAARKAFVIQDSGAHLVLTMSRRATELRGHTTASIYALDDLEALSRFPQAPVKLERPATPDDTCYCLYTSGTTGTPKGCEITHDNAVQFTLAFQRLLAGRWQPNSRFLQFASFHFDVSVMEQYWSWSVGICVTSAPRDLIFEDIARAIRRLEVTHVDLTPSLAKLISPEDAPALIDGAFITGGERLNQDVLDQWGPKLCIFNGYGPTEVTIGCTMNRRVPRDGNPANIGPQYDNVGSYVFRPGTAMLIPRGGIGELCVSGKLVGRGYLNRPELTQERFPYLDEFQERVYRTGDMVRVLYDGSFEYLGRVDDQVKLRGQRLEVHEINQVIRAGVKEVSEVVTLLAQHSASRREHLIAFFVTRPTKNGASRGQAQYDRHGGTVIRLARDACRHRLPAYMIPTFFVPLTAIPLSANNKADARELRELFSRIPIEQLRDLQQSLVRDRGPLSDPQKRVVEILAKMARVGAEDVQLESSIFTLGLDSITVISFARALREAGFSTAQTSVVLEHNTVGRLVDVLCRGGGTDLLRAPTEAADVDVRQRMAAFAHQHAFSVSRALHLPVDVIEGIAPCTALQEAMIARSTASGRPFYFSAFCYRLAEDMDLARFRDAWATVAEKAHILRTRFVSTADGHAQAVIKNAPLLWKEIHLQEDGDSSSAKALEFKTWHKQNQAMITTPFQLVIFRQRLEVQLGIFHHHALYDFWSHDLMLDRVMKEYKKASGISYGPSFQEVLVRGPLRRVEGASVFWTKLLAGAEYHPLPTREISECSVPPVTRHVTATGMEKLRRRLGTTHQAIIQACWIAVLRSILPSPVIIGTLVSGRSLDIEGIDETIGPLFNTVPFVIHLDPTDTWADLVRQCHDLNTSILPFQHTPLRDIMKWCNRSAGNPLFDIIFSFQKESQTMSTELEEVNSLHDEALLPDFLLAFEARSRSDDCLTLTVVTDGTISHRARSDTLLGKTEQALDAMTSDPCALVSASMEMVQFAHRPRSIEMPMTRKTSALGGGMAQEYEWSPTASQIRSEIATLTGSDESAITEQSSIFELGLDSIDAIKLSSRLHRFGIALSVSDIMQSGSILNMAGRLFRGEHPINKPKGEEVLDAQEQEIRRYLSSIHFDLSSVDCVLPATPLQEAMTAQLTRSNGVLYGNQVMLKLAPGVDVKRLHNAWTTVISNTPIWRTSFVPIDDPDIKSTYAQVVRRMGEIDWKAVDLSEGSVTQDKPKATDDEFSRDILARSPIALRFVKYPSDIQREDSLHLHLSHALYDGYSLALLHHDVHQAYMGKVVKRPSYRPFLNQILDSSGPDAETFWKENLDGVAPSSFPRRDNVVHHSDRRSFLRSSSSPSTVREYCRSSHITIQTLGQTCWALVLAHHLKKLDVVFGAVLSGRESEEANDVAFPMMNTVAVRSILHGTRKEMLQYMQDNSVNVSRYQHVSLRRAQQLGRFTLREQDLFDSLFIYQKKPDLTPNPSPALYQASTVGVASTVYPVNMEMEIKEDKVVWTVACRNSVFIDKELANLLSQIDTVLDELIRRPDRACVEFHQGEASICRLPWIQLGTSLPKDMERSRPGIGGEDTTLSDTEINIRDVLSIVGKIPPGDIRKDDTIFHLGLDSISTIKISSLLKKRSINLASSEIMSASSIRKMAALVASKRDGEGEGLSAIAIPTAAILKKALKDVHVPSALRSAGISSDEVEQVMPTTAGQSYMLALWQQARGALYYPTFTYRVERRLGRDRLERAWAKTKQDLAILRTTFVMRDDGRHPYLQVIMKENHRGVSWSYAGEEISPFDGDFPVLLSALDGENDTTTLRLKIHHALYDAISLPLLINSLQHAYNNPQSVAEVKTCDMADFIAYVTSQSGNTQWRDFWTRYLAESTSAKSRSQDEGREIGGGEEEEEEKKEMRKAEIFRAPLLNTSTVTDLEKVARVHGLGFQSIFLAAFSQVYAGFLSAVSPPTTTTATSSSSMTSASNSQKDKEADIILGTYISNRALTPTQALTVSGPTFNVVPLRIRRTSSQSNLALASRIHEDMQLITAIPPNACAGLNELYGALGSVKMDVCVNFLGAVSLAAGGVGDEERAKVVEQEAEGEIEIRQVQEERYGKDWKGVVEYPRPRPLSDSTAEHRELQHVYALPKLDVEARITRPSVRHTDGPGQGEGDVGGEEKQGREREKEKEQGGLYVGMFASTSNFDLTDVERLMTGLKRRLLAFL